MKRYFAFFVISLVLVVSSLAFAGKEEALVFYDGEFKGPFMETSIIRLYDPKYKVVCYLYIPKTVTTKITGSGIAIKGFAGNISCVKVDK